MEWQEENKNEYFQLRHSNFQQQQKSPNLQSKQAELEEYIATVGDINNLRQCYYQKVLLNNKKVKWTNQFSENIKIQTIEFDMQTLVVLVHYGNLKMRISTLMTSFNECEMKNQIIAEGAFGSIYKIQVDEKQYALKGNKIVVNEGQINLDHIYKEFFLTSISSFLGAGPKIQPIMGYDIVTFKKIACFGMEICKPVSEQKDDEKIKYQLVDCLRAIHSIGMVHLDIKPANIMYSQGQQKYVLIDYGFSRLIKEPLGNKTFSPFFGTIGFCSEEMMKTYWLGKDALIDLYYNDLVGVKKTRHALGGITKQQFDNFSCQGFESHQFQSRFAATSSYINSVAIICRLKYNIYERNIHQIMEIVKKNLCLSYTFYLIISDELFKSQLKESEQIKALLTDLRQRLLQYSSASSFFDQKISKLLLLKDKMILTPQIMTIQYTLELQDAKFLALLTQLDFVHRLFLIFNPKFEKKEDNQNLMLEKHSLRKKIVNKIFECIESNDKQAIFYEKIRKVTIFFYEKLRQLRNRDVFVSIRLMFLMLNYNRLIPEIQKQICELTSDFDERVFTAMEFALFQSHLNQIRQNRLNTLEFLIGKCDEKVENKRVLDFARKIISIGNFKYLEKQQALSILQQLNGLKKQKQSFEDQVQNVITLFNLLTRFKICLHYSQRLIDYVYQSIFIVPRSHRQFEFVVSLYRFEFLVRHNAKDSNELFENYKSQYSKIFHILKKLNMPKANIFGVKDKFYLRVDYHLALAAIQMYTQHVNSFELLSDQQVLDSFQTFDWMIWIMAQNLKSRRFNPKYKSSYNTNDTKNMVKIIQQSFRQLKDKTHEYKNMWWYIAVTSVIQTLLLLFTQDYGSIEQNLASLKQFMQLPSSCYQIILIYANLIYYVIEKSEQPNSKIPEVLLRYCQSALERIPQKYSKKQYLELLLETSLFESITGYYIRRRDIRKFYGLLKWMANEVNEADYYFNKSSLIPFLKFAIQIFCRESEVQLWILWLDEFSKKPLSNVHPEELYIEYLLFYKISQHNSKNYNLSIIQKPLYPGQLQICLKTQFIRIGKASFEKYYSFSKEIDSCLNECYRHNFISHTQTSQRKKLICLRREGKYRSLQKKWLRKVEKWRTETKIEEKIHRLCRNAEKVSPNEDFIIMKLKYDLQGEKTTK